MERFAVPAALSVVIGLLLGALAVFAATAMIESGSNTMPLIPPADKETSLLNRVEYGQRT